MHFLSSLSLANEMTDTHLQEICMQTPTNCNKKTRTFGVTRPTKTNTTTNYIGHSKRKLCKPAVEHENKHADVPWSFYKTTSHTVVELLKPDDGNANVQTFTIHTSSGSGLCSFKLVNYEHKMQLT